MSDGRSLWRRKEDLLRQLSEIDEQIEQARKADNHIKRAEDITWTTPEATMGMKGRHKIGLLISPEFGYNCYTLRSFMIEMPPKTSEGPYHTHGEAIKYYLSGKGRENIGSKTYEVKAGDACLIPANIWHGTDNPYDEPFKFVAVAQASGLPIPVPVIRKIREDLRTTPV